MAKKRIQPGDEEIARRAMNLARQISGRLFVTADGVHLVSGSPSFEKLLHCLSGIQEPPRTSDAPGPLDLGFTPSQITPLTEDLLATWGRALQKWRKVLDDYDQPKQKSSERRTRYRRWADEINRLSASLDHLWETLRLWKGGRPVPGAPYVSEHTATIVGPFVDMPTDRLPVPLLTWLERVVTWIAGPAAGLRFRESLHAASLQSHPPAMIAGSAAALCAADGAAAPIPRLFLSACYEVTPGQVIRVFSALHQEHAEPGYEALLRGLAVIPLVPDTYLRTIRQWLLLGVEADDVTWAMDAFHWRGSMLSGKGLSPRPIRLLTSVLERTGLRLIYFFGHEDAGDLIDVPAHELFQMVCERGSTDIVEAFVQWLSSLNPDALDASVGKWAWGSLQQLLALEGVSPALRSHLKRWSNPPASGEGDELSAITASPQTREWLSRLFFYQRLCGREPAVPDSVARLLDPGAREARELEHLREARVRGSLSEGMAVRLERLEGRGPAHRVASEHRVQKQIQEACAHAALQAAGVLAKREGRRLWDRLLSCEPPGTLSEGEITAIAAWAAGLGKAAAKRLREVLDAWLEAGTDYRGLLAPNSAWIEAARGRMDLQAWFAPSAHETTIDGMPIRICVAPDPFTVFLMGTYFGTCLSLDKFNRDSVLANAYDANKAVVFAMGPEGQVLARKLACVSSGFELLGYRTYVSADNSLTEARRRGIGSLVEAFCGCWARRVGLSLGSAGKPTKLSGLFWIDDGVVPWTVGAKLSWTHSSVDAVHDMGVGSALMPQVAAALETRRDDCVQLLSQLGIWPPGGGHAPAELADSPGFAEETLAVLARIRQDRELARTLLENATTEGGRLEAVTSVAILEKTDEAARQVYLLGEQNVKNADRATEILRAIGTKLAWRLFMKMALGNAHPDALWIPLAAADSDDSAEALFEPLASPGQSFLSHVHLLLTSEILLARGMAFPPAAVRSLLFCFSYLPRARCSLAQWLPPYPNTFRRAEILKIGRMDDTFGEPGDSLYAAMSAIIVAMRNPGSGSTAYLRGAAEQDPSALLALSLQAGPRYRDFIRGAAVAAACEPAAILALLVREGEEEAKRLLAPTCGVLPDQEDRLDQVCRLHRAFHDLDEGNRVTCFAESSGHGTLFSTLPYALHWIWRWADPRRPNIAAIAALLCTDSLNIMLAEFCIDRCGLAARLAVLARESCGEDLLVLRRAILVLLDLIPSGGMIPHAHPGSDWSGYALPLDMLSGGKLLAGDPAIDHAPVPVGYNLECPGMWELILDEVGNPRSVFGKLDWSDLWDIRLPMDKGLAARACRLLSAHVPAEQLSGSLLPITEIEKELVRSMRCDRDHPANGR